MIHVCSLAALPETVRLTRASHVLTVMGKVDQVQRPASIRPENHASRRVVEKLGFREEGIRVRQLHINGSWRDHVCYALTAEEVPQGLMPSWRSMVLASRSSAG